jgi:hypothetical protein
LALSTCSALAQVDHIFRSEVAAGVDDAYNNHIYEDDSALHTISTTGPTGFASASATMAYGVNKVSTHWETLDASNPAGVMIADANSIWGDLVTISDPALDGTIGTFTASMRVFGSAEFTSTGAYLDDASANIYGFWNSYIGTSTDGGGSWLVHGWSGDWRSEGDGPVVYSGDELNNPLTEVTIEFVYGTPFLLGGLFEAYSDAENENLAPGTASSTLDFSHSAYWNGISNFYDENGHVVTGVNMTSHSGIDWRKPINAVPEPASFAALGLGALALMKRRRGTA